MLLETGKLVALLTISLLTGSGTDSLAAENSDGSDATLLQYFSERIEPVLKAECYQCHSKDANKIEGGLRLDSGPGILRGGDSGPAIVLGKPDESLLLQALRHQNSLQMPPNRDPLPGQVIADFKRWIEKGAMDPRHVEPELAETDDPKNHWAFQPLSSPALPGSQNPADVRNPVDAFVLARLEQEAWKQAPAVDRAAWIRRVAMDLIGLPLEPAQVQTFLQDASPQAYEKVVDQLLDSPHFGERQAQHWLDVIRYAETEGFEYDTHLPGAWQFRDYVIDSMNRDKPFDQFITEQIAGDELDANNTEYQTASIFHRLGPVRRNAGNPELALSRNEVLTERTDVIGTAILGLSIGCARCHNHKLEPISQKDYYCLQAYFAATDENNLTLASPAQQDAWQKSTEDVRAHQARLREQARVAAGPERSQLEKEAEELESRRPEPLPQIPGTRNNFLNQTAIHILHRGVWEQKGERVGPRPLSILVGAHVPELPLDVENPRTLLAKWLTAADNPLTARVIVNRVWQHHFGLGIVSTPNDFGTRGGVPSHPELLDWLASYLIKNRWQLKSVHRLIVLSETYRQGCDSAHVSDATISDPENRLLWHFPRRRLTAEQLRDAMLMVSGRLNRAAGGPGIMTPVDPELVQLLYKPAQWQVPADSSNNDRRSVYLIAKRNLRLPFMEVFDAPTLMSSCARRESSTHAPQALELLNGSFSNSMAHSLAARLRMIAGSDSERLTDSGFSLVLGRMPNAAEKELSIRFLAEQPLEEFALALFNLNDFLYVP